MFVPVGCTSCGKPFQVPQANLGATVACPWCQTAVTALPVAAPTPAPTPPAPVPPAPAPLTSDAAVHTGGAAARATERAVPAGPIPPRSPLAPEPLSLDDEPAKPAPADAGPRFTIRPAAVVAVVAVSLLVTALTVAALGYGSGRVTDADWAEFTPPDGSCSVLLPAAPVEEAVAANPAGSVLGGKRYVARGWYTRSAAWLAWGDLDPGFAAAAAKDRDKAITAAAIRAELDRERVRLQGTVTKEAEVRFAAAWGVEVHLDTPRGRVVEWLLVAPDGPRPRLYCYGLRATNITPDSAVVRRMFTSFRVNE